jgi:hypothetical protein
VRSFFEPRFGQSLAHVRVHSEAFAHAASDAIGARAFTHGSDIFFARDAYAPSSASGKALLAHELAHAVQPREHAADRIWRDDIEHEPQHRNQTVATWTGWSETVITATTAVGESPIAYYVGPVGAVPHSLVREGWTPGHYESEAAALAAVRAAGTAGAVFIENGRYVAYHVSVPALIYDFTWENIVWDSDEPWTSVRFDSNAIALVTQDGAIVRPNAFKSEDDAESALSDEAFMPGEADPFTGYREAFGDFNNIPDTTFFLMFEAAMKDNALSVLKHSHRAAQREVERRSMCGVVPREEIELMRSTASSLAAIDEELEGLSRMGGPAVVRPAYPYVNYPGDLSRWEDRNHHRQRLERERRTVLAQYPMLARVDARAFAAMSETEQQQALGAEAYSVLDDIAETRANVLSGSLDLWALRPIVESTIMGLGIIDPDRRQMVLDRMESTQRLDAATTLALAVLSLGFGLAAAFVSGPLGLAFAAGAFGLGTADAIRETQDWLVESAAANTALVPDESLMDPERVGHWGWLVVAWVGVGFDAADVVRAIGRIRAAGGAIEAGVTALTRDDNRARALRVAAGEIPGEQITLATRAVVSQRLGADVEIVESLGREIRVVYEVDSRGRVVLQGVRCGPQATIVEIVAHGRIVRLLRRYDGVLGRIRALLDRMRSLAGRHAPGTNPFPPGSQAFESWLELQKLPDIIALRRAELGQELGLQAESLLRRDVAFLESELAQHQDVVDRMVLESGAGYVARAQERTAEAVRGGMPALEGNPLIQDASRYYYRTNPRPPPPYQLTRFQHASVPPRTLVPDGNGGWEIAVGNLSRAERAEAMVRGWPQQVQDAFSTLGGQHQGAFRVVPLEGVATSGRRLGEMDPELLGRLHEVLFEALQRNNDPDPFGNAASLAHAVSSHEVVVVRGTDQLRAFNYRLNFANEAGEAASGDLHHLIPLYLGGDHRRLIDVHQDLHDRLHDIIDEIPFEQGTTLAPHSIRSSGGLDFAAGAAVLNSDGTVQLFRLNADGTFTPVP